MGARGTTFGKLERERAKKAKAAAKRARRQERSSEGPDSEAQETPTEDTLPEDSQDPLSAAELLELVEATHRNFEAGIIGLEEFEEKKAALLARLPID